MIVLRPPAELAATVRRVADRLPLHLHAEARDLHQAADENCKGRRCWQLTLTALNRGDEHG